MTTVRPPRRRWTRAELAGFEGAVVDDLHGPTVRPLFVGINPGLMTAATNTHFAHPSNRFYKAPAVGAVAGLTAYRTAFDQPRAVTGEQPGGLAGARLWVVPNPSGLNAHETADSLSVVYRQAAVAAGLRVGPRPCPG